MRLKLLLIFFSLSLLNSLQAQLTEGADNSKYFIEPGNSSKNQIIKVRLMPMVHGEYGLSYERKLFRNIALEVGAGLLQDLTIPELANDEIYELTEGTYGNFKGGYAFTVKPKIYYGTDYPQGFYYGLMYRNRAYQFTTSNVTQHTIGGIMGMQLRFFNHFIVDGGAGIGKDIFSVDNPIPNPFEVPSKGLLSGLYFQFTLGLGVAF